MGSRGRTEGFAPAYFVCNPSVSFADSSLYTREPWVRQFSEARPYGSDGVRWGKRTSQALRASSPRQKKLAAFHFPGFVRAGETALRSFLLPFRLKPAALGFETVWGKTNLSVSLRLTAPLGKGSLWQQPQGQRLFGAVGAAFAFGGLGGRCGGVGTGGRRHSLRDLFPVSVRAGKTDLRFILRTSDVYREVR